MIPEVIAPLCPSCYWGGSQGCGNPVINSILDADPALAARVGELCIRYSLYLPAQGASR
ncbi:MAG: hypothetical protein ACP5NN_06755 [Methanolinea sp.]